MIRNFYNKKKYEWQQDKLEMLKKQEADMLAALKQKGVEEEIKFEKHKMKSQEVILIFCASNIANTILKAKTHES